eukprot:Opistho-2@91174
MTLECPCHFRSFLVSETHHRRLNHVTMAALWLPLVLGVRRIAVSFGNAQSTRRIFRLLELVEYHQNGQSVPQCRQPRIELLWRVGREVVRAGSRANLKGKACGVSVENAHGHCARSLAAGERNVAHELLLPLVLVIQQRFHIASLAENKPPTLPRLDTSALLCQKSLHHNDLVGQLRRIHNAESGITRENEILVDVLLECGDTFSVLLIGENLRQLGNGAFNSGNPLREALFIIGKNEKCPLRRVNFKRAGTLLRRQRNLSVGRQLDVTETGVGLRLFCCGLEISQICCRQHKPASLEGLCLSTLLCEVSGEDGGLRWGRSLPLSRSIL